MGKERTEKSKRSAGQGHPGILTGERLDGKSWNRRKKAQKPQEERRETDRQAQRGVVFPLICLKVTDTLLGFNPVLSFTF